MSQKLTFVCDICNKEFSNRNKEYPDTDPRSIEPVGGMSGFAKRMVPAKDGELKEELMQYNFDLCPEHNKAMIDRYFELGGN